MTHKKGSIRITSIDEVILAHLGNPDAFIRLDLDKTKGTISILVHNEHGSAMNTFQALDFTKMLDMFNERIVKELGQKDDSKSIHTS